MHFLIVLSQIIVIVTYFITKIEHILHVLNKKVVILLLVLNYTVSKCSLLSFNFLITFRANPLVDLPHSQEAVLLINHVIYLN